MRLRGFLQKGDIEQKNGNHVQSEHNRTSIKKTLNIYIHKSVLLCKSNIPVTKDRIAGGKFDVNSSKYFEGSTFKKPGEISIIPNQPEARLIESSDRALSKVILETKRKP